MRLIVKRPWFGPAKYYRGLKISTWQGALVTLVFFAVLFLDITKIDLLLIKIVVGLLDIVTVGFIVYKTGDLTNSIVF